MCQGQNLNTSQQCSEHHWHCTARHCQQGSIWTSPGLLHDVNLWSMWYSFNLLHGVLCELTIPSTMYSLLLRKLHHHTPHKQWDKEDETHQKMNSRTFNMAVLAFLNVVLVLFWRSWILCCCKSHLLQHSAFHFQYNSTLISVPSTPHKQERWAHCQWDQ